MKRILVPVDGSAMSDRAVAYVVATFPDTQVCLLHVEAAPTLSIDDLAALSPADFFERLYQHRFGEAAPSELTAAFAELLNTPSEAPVES